MYDTQTRSLLQPSQPLPTIGSQTTDMPQNAEGAYDIYFAPEATGGKEGN